MIIYKITNKITGDIYIGQTIDSLERRISKHFRGSKYSDTRFSRAIRKYGKENFIYESIFTCLNKEELSQIEKFFIQIYNAQSYIYNTSKGGDGGDTLSLNPNIESIKRKMSESRKGKKAYQYRHDITTKQIIELRNKKMSHLEISKILNCSKKVVANRLKEARYAQTY